MTEAIRTEHLKFSYDAQSESGGVTVFDDLNLSIEEGSFVAVLGHNGCGKSTLAKHFNAVLLPEGGSVQVFGMDTSDESLLVDIRRTVGMVFQNPDNQMVANVVEEDVAFAPENLGVPSEEIRRRVDEALKLVGTTVCTRRTCSPAGRSSAWPLRESSPCGRAASYSMSRPPCSTPTGARRSFRPSSA